MGKQLSPEKTAARTAKFKATMAAKRAMVEVPDAVAVLQRSKPTPMARREQTIDPRVMLALKLAALFDKVLS